MLRFLREEPASWLSRTFSLQKNHLAESVASKDQAYTIYVNLCTMIIPLDHSSTPRVRGVDLCIIIVHHSPLRYRYVHHSPLRYRYGDRQCFKEFGPTEHASPMLSSFGEVLSVPGRVGSLVGHSLVSSVSSASPASPVSSVGALASLVPTRRD